MDLAFVLSFFFACRAARVRRAHGAWRSRRQFGSFFVPGKGRRVFLVTGEHRGTVASFSGPPPFCFPPLEQYYGCHRTDRASAGSLAGMCLSGNQSTDLYQRFAQDYQRWGKYRTERRVVIVDIDDAEAKAVRLLTRWRDRKEGSCARTPFVAEECSDGDNAIRAARVNLSPSVVALVVTVATANPGERQSRCKSGSSPCFASASPWAPQSMAPPKMEMVMKMMRCARLQVRVSEPPTWRAKDAAGYPWPPMGPGGPLLVRQGDVMLHKEQISARQRAHKQFTQVRATARHKTLLLLWWIDGRMNVVVRGTLARQGLPRGSSDYARAVAWACQLSNPLTPSTSAIGLLL
nr:uncharacterized protein LOC120962986 [Aegilops tauschii subsp. strangulata]